MHHKLGRNMHRTLTQHSQCKDSVLHVILTHKVSKITNHFYENVSTAAIVVVDAYLQ
jgi:hypothetical protein